MDTQTADELRRQYAAAMHKALRDYGEGDADPGTGSDYGDQTAVVLAVRDRETEQLRARVTELEQQLADADGELTEAREHNDRACEAVAGRDQAEAAIERTEAIVTRWEKYGSVDLRTAARILREEVLDRAKQPSGER